MMASSHFSNCNRMRTYLEPISDPLVFISVGVAYLKWWPQVRWKGLDAKRVDVFLGLKY